VTITGVDDALQDGDQESLVTIAVDAARSDSDFASAGAQTVSVTTVDNDRSWQNLDNPCDVNKDGLLTAADALLVIEYVNRHPENPTLPSPPPLSPPYYDVNDDGLCTAMDVLLVINAINTQDSTSNEGGDASGEGEGVTPSNAAALDARLLPSPPSLLLQQTPPARGESRCLADAAICPTHDLATPVSHPASLPIQTVPAVLRNRVGERLQPAWPSAVDAVWEIWERETGQNP
jgi:hypothetical protein